MRDLSLTLLAKHRCQTLWLDDLDLVTPGEKVPRHLEKTAGAKPNHEGAVFQTLGLLSWMKQKLASVFGGLGCELPNDVDGLLLEDSK